MDEAGKYNAKHLNMVQDIVNIYECIPCTTESDKSIGTQLKKLLTSLHDRIRKSIDESNLRTQVGYIIATFETHKIKDLNDLVQVFQQEAIMEVFPDRVVNTCT